MQNIQQSTQYTQYQVVTIAQVVLDQRPLNGCSVVVVVVCQSVAERIASITTTAAIHCHLLLQHG